MDGELVFLMDSGDGRNDGRDPGIGDLLSELDERVLGEFELERMAACKGDGVMDCLSSKLINPGDCIPEKDLDFLRSWRCPTPKLRLPSFSSVTSRARGDGAITTGTGGGGGGGSVENAMGTGPPALNRSHSHRPYIVILRICPPGRYRADKAACSARIVGCPPCPPCSCGDGLLRCMSAGFGEGGGSGDACRAYIGPLGVDGGFGAFG